MERERHTHKEAETEAQNTETDRHIHTHTHTHTYTHTHYCTLRPETFRPVKFNHSFGHKKKSRKCPDQDGPFQ